MFFTEISLVLGSCNPSYLELLPYGTESMRLDVSTQRYAEKALWRHSQAGRHAQHKQGVSISDQRTVIGLVLPKYTPMKAKKHSFPALAFDLAQLLFTAMATIGLQSTQNPDWR